jgi:hypothetical protein
MRALRDFLLVPSDGAALEPRTAALAPLHGAVPECAEIAVAEPAPLAPARAIAWPFRERRAAATAGAAPAVQRSVAILCAAEDARAVGVAAATLLARRARTGCGLALVWTAPQPRPPGDARPPATRAARRLAVALAARELAGRPCGRAVELMLPPDSGDALAVARRATAAAGDAPVVLALGGPRAAAFDDVLAEQDGVLVLMRPGADAALAALAVAALPPAAGVAHPFAIGPAARVLAAAGLVVPGALRRALAALAEDDPG